MKFIDEIEIKVRAGHGGAGCVSFLREKFRAFGGPDGGDGGRGGNLYISAHPSLQTLGHLLKARVYRAGNGEPGRGRKQTGANGEDAEVHVPIGTEVLDAHSGLLIADLNRPDARECVAEGGKGGQGNTHFASAVNQSPEYAQPGMPGEERILLLRLKLLADAGLVGLPNAGKSTLLNALLQDRRAIVSDIAGTTRDSIEEVLNINGLKYRLIDTAGIRMTEDTIEAEGVERTLLHVQNAKILLYLFDIMHSSPEEVETDIQELISKNHLNPKTKILLLANKSDLSQNIDLDDFREKMGDAEILSISALNNDDVEDLKSKLYDSIISGKVTEDKSMINNIRHYEALQKANESLQIALDAMNTGMSTDLIALDIRKVLFHLGLITGEVSSEDLLDSIFTRFCIGK